MKILFVYSTLADKGPTRQLLYIARYLKRTGHEPQILTMSPEGAKSLLKIFRDEELPVHSLNLSRFEAVFNAKRSLLEFLRTQKFQIIHSHGLRPDALVSSLTATVPHVISIRNVPWIDYPMKYGKVLGTLMAKYHLRILKKCKVNVGCSSSIQDSLIPYISSVRYIRNGVEIPSPQNKADLRQNKGIKPGKKVVVWAGSLIPRKNLKDFISAIKLLEKYAELTFVILGEGPDKNLISASENIISPGHVTDVREWYFLSDLFVSTSFSEGLPNAVLEAISCGLPVLVSDIPSHREILDMGPQMEFYPLGDVTTLAEKILAKNQAVPTNMEAISSDRMAAEYLSLYSELLVNK